MKKYKVIKPFFKLSEQKNYFINDEIELTPEEAKSIDLYVVEIKENKFILEVNKKTIDKAIDTSIKNSKK